MSGRMRMTRYEDETTALRQRPTTRSQASSLANGSAVTTSETQVKDPGRREDESPIRNAARHAAEGASEAAHKIKETLHVSWEHAPSWMKDNNFIISGYRPALNSYASCGSSIFQLHNETINIWSHMVPAILAFSLVTLLSWSRLAQQPSVQVGDYLVFGIFILAATACLGFSSTYHCLIAHSEIVAFQYNRLDYLGIVVLIVGSFYPAVYYGFYCHAKLQIIYLSAITILGAATIVVMMADKYRTAEYRWIRTAMFLSLGLSAVIPVGQALISYGFEESVKSMSLKYLMTMGALYISGALIYAARVPERFFPGKFDLFLNSHQIFHILIVIAAISHYFGVCAGFNYWHGEMGGSCPRV